MIVPEPLQDFDRTPTALYPRAITVFYYYDLNLLDTV